jgi:hypothetical protein
MIISQLATTQPYSRNVFSHATLALLTVTNPNQLLTFKVGLLLALACTPTSKNQASVVNS